MRRHLCVEPHGEVPGLSDTMSSKDLLAAREFHLFDLHLSQLTQDQRLRELLSHCFGCSAEDVRVIDEIETPEQFDNCVVLVERFVRAGDFPLSLSVVSCPQGCVESNADLASQLCNLTQCTALVSDSTVNPYNWVILDGLGNHTEVLVDGDALDDDDAFVIPDARRPT